MEIDYLSLEQHSSAWVYDCLDVEERADVRPLTRQSSVNEWRRIVSAHNGHSMTLAADEWPNQSNTWLYRGRWDARKSFPEELAHLCWAEDARVYFTEMDVDVVEIRWGTFKRHWRAIVLRQNEGSLLLHPARPEVACFGPDGTLLVGIRPDTHRG